MSPRPRSFVLLLSALTAITALSIDMSLAALPLLQRQFHAPDGTAQLTLSLFLLGYAVGQLACGPLSDRHGRRPLLLIGLGLYVLASVGCVFAPSLPALIALRFVQGVGGSFGPVLARAMVRDCFDRSESSQVLSHITQVMVIGPLIAPTLGGLLLVRFGWHSIFVFLSVSGGLLWLLSWRAIAETRPPPDSRAARPPFWGGLRRVAVHPVTLRAGLLTFCVGAGMFAFISASPFIIMDVFGVPKARFGLVFSLVAVGLLAGASANRRWLPTVGPAGMIRWGLGGITGGGVVMLALVAAHRAGLAGVIGPMVGYLFGVGLLMPNITAAGMEPHGRLAGLASSLLGSAQTLGSALAGYATGRLFDGTPLPMAATVAAMGVLALAVAAWRRGPLAAPSTEAAEQAALAEEYVE